MAYIGAHLGIGRGLDKTAQQAVEMELECLQIFLRNPRGSRARQLKEMEIITFKNLLAKYRISPLVVHVSYICNPAAANPHLYELAHSIVAEDLARSAQIGADYLVLHPGSYTTSSAGEGMVRVANLLNRVLENDSGPVTVLLETMSGQGTELGGDFEQLHQILQMIKRSDRVGICYDTCHTYAAGYDCKTTPGMENILSHIDGSFGRERIKLVHANDCASSLGSHRDRHAHVGEGSIGLEGFASLLSHNFWGKMPMIVETPIEGLAGDIIRLKELRDNSRGDYIHADLR